MYDVKDRLAKDAHIAGMAAYQARYDRCAADPDDYWLGEAKQRLTWFVEPEVALQGGYQHLDFTWFAGGKLNASYQCIDRHLTTRGDKTAIIWAADEVGVYEHISYAELNRRVGQMANVLLRFGVQKGDRVCLYLPMIPELAVAMLACARIGAIHSIVFAGFSASALRDRILDADCKVVMTADQGLRGGKTIPLKLTTDEAVSQCPCVETVLVAERTGADVSMTAGRDHWLAPLVAAERPHSPPVWMDAEDPLFILYTSGSTGKPKGVQHSTGGYMLYASYTHELVFDIHEDDVYFCAADIGWITGHSYIIYGPLANGATTVMFESTPLYPDASRYWSVVEDLEITVFYTAPTAIRAIAREGDEPVNQHNRSSLRVLGTVGEPINPDVWEWYHDVVGQGRCAIVDTWWQTETGGIMISPLPGATPTKPGSATLPLPGVEPLLVDDEGLEIEGNGVSGNLCMRRPWPGQARTIYGDHHRFSETYFSHFPGLYFTGDGCDRDDDGYYWITGRVDDVINVSGHRMGTAEVESALVAHETVAEAAVVGFPHEIKGTGIYAYVQTTSGDANALEVVEALRAQVRKEIGPIATPDRIQLVPGLPKTRSGKIMRRILRKVALGEYSELGDVSTLADPTVVEAIVEGHRQEG
ncbi:MAG TPA: acetate--CoA ligase [Myxococcales bacterium]|nr:acetate--CoA ligase [Myxococcales bacterium]